MGALVVQLAPWSLEISTPAEFPVTSALQATAHATEE
jgi:hypothetical protein